MTFKRAISGLMLALMLAMQVLLIRHTLAHGWDDMRVSLSAAAPGAQAVDADVDMDDGGGADACHLCAVIKSFSDLNFTPPAVFTAILTAFAVAAAILRERLPAFAPRAYAARGPPAA